MRYCPDLKLKIWGKPLPEIPPDAPKVQIVEPQKGQLVFVAPNATLLGDIKLGDMSSVWYGAVLRGEGLIKQGFRCITSLTKRV